MPSNALDAVGRLRRLAVMLEDGDADHRWLAARLARYLTEAPLGLASMELALDLDPGRGGVSWFEEERRDQRDHLLRDIAARHFPGLAPGPAAKALTASWRRYCRNRRAFDARHGESAAAPGTIDAALFQLARLDGPPEERRVRDILASAEQSSAA